MTRGTIQVEVHDLEAHYEATCACGWTGGEAASIEFSELALLGHFDRMHKEQAA